MDRYVDVGWEAWRGYARYLGHELLHPGPTNYVTLLVTVSLFFWGWEVVRPWRRKQGPFREGFWLDAFYMAFNFFGFGLLGYVAVSRMSDLAVRDGLAAIGLEDLVLVDAKDWSVPAQLLLFFVVRDLVHYGIHRLLHRHPVLWRFHQVHHSVREMGFAAHLRFHFAETIVYRVVEWVPLALLGFGVTELFLAHATAVAIGHWNHANIRLPLGPLRFVLNGPQMHLWHHARDLPPDRLARHRGVNFGLSLSLWDYLFGTAYEPDERPEEPLGFPGVDDYPRTFWRQLVEPLRIPPPPAG